jgi:PAS domain S-box-containing protein
MGRVAEPGRLRGTGSSDPVIESLPCALFVLDQRGRLVGWNRYAAAALGCSERDLRGLDPLLIFPAEERARAAAAMQQVLREGSAYIETLVLTSSGERRHYLFVARRKLLRGEPHVVGVAVDVTGNRQARDEEGRLRAALERAAGEWRHTFDAMESPILILDTGWRVVRLNRAAAEEAGRSFGECLGRPLVEMGAGDPWSAAAGMETEMRNERAAFRQTRNASDGRSWDLAVTRMSGEARDTRFLLLMRDVTAVTELQESVRQAEKMVAMGTLTAGVAHEVRNPLFAISANVDALEMVLEGREDVADLVAAVRSQVRRLGDLMVDLLELGRPTTTTLSEGALERVVDTAVQGCSALAARAGVRLAKLGAERSYAVMMDHGRLTQVLDNLLENAIQHSPRGGLVQVELTEFQEEGREWVKCTVLDQGPGFRPEDLSRVFEPFFSRRRGGTGLGLSIVHRIVEMHAGRLRARNREEGGAAVAFDLPRVLPP